MNMFRCSLLMTLTTFLSIILFINADQQTWTINGITTRTSFQLSARDKRQQQQQQPKNRSILSNINDNNGRFVFDVRISFCFPYVHFI